VEALTAEPSVVDALVHAYDLAVTTGPESLTPVGASRFKALARTGGDRPIVGFGAGATEQAARVRAVLECVERLAQFAAREPPGVVACRLDELPDAVAPAELGLYSSHQYAALSGRVTAFSEEMVLDWLPMRDLRTGRERFVPVETVHPRAPLRHLPLVLETSSGTAAHLHYGDALLAGLCEVVERDAVLVFWHRQPRTPQLSVELLPDPVREEMRHVQAAGHVVIVADLTYLEVPCFLVLALRRTALGYGLGCHPDPAAALAHAVRELGARLGWMAESAHGALAHLPVGAVVSGSDHYGLYHNGPLHGVLRDVLSSALRPPNRPASSPAGQPAPAPKPVRPGWPAVAATLAESGFPVLARDITPARARDCGAVVVRVVVPGLVPFHVGGGTLRLGCARLTGTTAPGQLRNLLPHFLS